MSAGPCDSCSTFLQATSSSTISQQLIETALAAGTPVAIGMPVHTNFFYVTTARNGLSSGILGGLADYHGSPRWDRARPGYGSTAHRAPPGERAGSPLVWSFVNHTRSEPSNSGRRRPGCRSAAPRPRSAAPAARAAATCDGSAGIRVLVAAINSHGQTTAASAATGPVKASPPANTSAPSISGTASSGATLTTNAGVWSPAGFTFSYDWQRETAGHGYQDIAGASGVSAYSLRAHTGSCRSRRSRRVETAPRRDRSLVALSVQDIFGEVAYILVG